MGDVGALSTDDLSFLERYLPSRDGIQREESTRVSKEGLPFVTLTYASSLDSMIALAVGARTTLSGAETKRMTHYLRLRHDAILVGAGTAEVDNPSLNCRYPGATLGDQPRPVIVDPNQRWDFGRESKLMTLASERQGKGPWVVARTETPSSAALQAVGGDHLYFNSDECATGAEDNQKPLIPWLDILRALKQRGINSVMIEGGARVINQLLCMPGLVDSVIITIAPTWLGHGGVAVQPPAKKVDGERVNSAWLGATSWRQFGNDVVLCGRLSSEKDAA